MLVPSDSQATATFPAVEGGEAGEKESEVLGGSLEAFRDYLTLMARRKLAPDLAAKVGASDLVQETFLAAARHFAQLRDPSPANLRCWLEGILRHLLANTCRRYRATQRRCVDLELRDGRGAGETGEGWMAYVSASATSVSGRAMRHEWENALRQAVMDLP
jgi:DNA-directed RNA polymerase specialized sigma24 family protein